MGYLMVVLVAIGLSMDSLAMSAQKSMIREYRGRKIAMSCAFWFGLTQTSMVLFGLMLGTLVSKIYDLNSYIWVPCAALGLAGAYMIFESFTSRIPPDSDGLDAGAMIIPAIATSCDALLVGLLFSRSTFAAVWDNAVLTIYGLLVIFLVTSLMSVIGVWIGRRKGTRFNGILQLVGGCVLILVGVEKLLEGMGVIGWVL